MRLVVFLALIFIWFVLAVARADAAGQPGALTAPKRGDVELVIFSEPGCPYCARAKDFLAGTQETRDWLIVRDIDISASTDSQEMFQQICELFEIKRPGVPLIVVGGRPFLGFDDAPTTGAMILETARVCRHNGCPKLADVLAAHKSGATTVTEQPAVMRRTIELPVIGAVSLASLSLPALTILLAAVDGFNPCAMWVLVFLVGLLVGMQDRMRMWLLGGAFLLTSGLVYFGFLAAWLNLFLLLGAVIWVRIAVGFVALASGAYYLHSFGTNAAAECRVTNPVQRKRIMDALRASVSEKRFLAALAGIVVLAAAVNLIELFCSAGIPAVFTEVLAMNNLPAWQHYLYLLLYVAVFILDDAVIFIVAILTLTATGMTNRYLRASHLIGGVGMLVIGGLLLFAPEWLTFTA